MASPTTSACRAAARRAPTPIARRPRGLHHADRGGRRPGHRACDSWLKELDDDGASSAPRPAREVGHRPGHLLGPAARRRRCLHPLRPGAWRDLMRFALTPILCGDRAAAGQRWHELVSSTRREARSRGAEGCGGRADAAHREPPGFHLARARRLLRGVRPLGPHRLRHREHLPGRRGAARFHPRVAPYVRYCHAKDYRVQFTDEGYPARPLPDGRWRGAVQGAVRDPRRAQRDDARRDRDRRARGASRQAASRRSGGTAMRPSRPTELAACLLAAQRNRLADEADWRTPWERNADHEIDRLRARTVPTLGREHEVTGTDVREAAMAGESRRKDRFRHRLGPRPRQRHGAASSRRWAPTSRCTT